MSLNLTLFKTTSEEVMSDVYFQKHFLKLHARPDQLDFMETSGFRHASVVRQIPHTDFEDLETPWGYGGPVALDWSEFWRGIGEWKQRQANKGRIAEFIRLHPFLNPLAFRGWLDQVRFDRLTVLIDLTESESLRHRYYSKGTRYCLRQADKALTVRTLEAGEGQLFKHLYESGLLRNNASDSYFMPLAHFEELIIAPWARVRVAEFNGRPVAVACFLYSRVFSHYHLSGGELIARETFAHHLLVEDAIKYSSDNGQRWMHLGGGRDRSLDDSLLLFKTRFSPRRVAYYTGGIIFDYQEYENLTKDRTGNFLSYRFRPTSDLENKSVNLRLATKNDFAFFFRLKCDIDNVVWSGHAAPPEWNFLKDWYFDKFKDNSVRQVFIGECDDRRIGYIYLLNKNSCIEVTLGIATTEAGHGMGRKLITLAMQKISELYDPRLIEAWIFEENKASVRAFEAVGFRKDTSRKPKSFNMPFLGNNRLQYCWTCLVESTKIE